MRGEDERDRVFPGVSLLPESAVEAGDKRIDFAIEHYRDQLNVSAKHDDQLGLSRAAVADVFETRSLIDADMLGLYAAALSEEERSAQAKLRNIDEARRSMLRFLPTRETTEVLARYVADQSIEDTFAHPRWLASTEAVADASPAAYWLGIRASLQRWLSMSLEELAEVIGIAKATVVYIGAPGRSVRPSTATKVLNLYGALHTLADEKGEDFVRRWAAHEGKTALQQGSLAFERAIKMQLLRPGPSVDAIPIDIAPPPEDDDVPTSAPMIRRARLRP